MIIPLSRRWPMWPTGPANRPCAGLGGIVVPVRVSGVVIEEDALRSTVMFVVLYLFVFAVGALSLVLDARRTGGQLGAFEALGAAAPAGERRAAFGQRLPLGSYAGFTDVWQGDADHPDAARTRRDRADRRALHPVVLAPMRRLRLHQ